MRKHYYDDAEVDARAAKINSQLKRNRLGEPPQRKIAPCRRCGSQALLEIIDKQWCYSCLACGEETPAFTE